jgi:hypothetical protein
MAGAALRAMVPALPPTAPVQPWARAARELLAQLPEEFPPRPLVGGGGGGVPLALPGINPLTSRYAI